jgi:hypothetical protein
MMRIWALFAASGRPDGLEPVALPERPRRPFRLFGRYERKFLAAGRHAVNKLLTGDGSAGGGAPA